MVVLFEAVFERAMVGCALEKKVHRANVLQCGIACMLVNTTSCKYINRLQFLCYHKPVENKACMEEHRECGTYRLLEMQQLVNGLEFGQPQIVGNALHQGLYANHRYDEILSGIVHPKDLAKWQDEQSKHHCSNPRFTGVTSSCNSSTFRIVRGSSSYASIAWLDKTRQNGTRSKGARHCYSRQELISLHRSGVSGYMVAMRNGCSCMWVCDLGVPIKVDEYCRWFERAAMSVFKMKFVPGCLVVDAAAHPPIPCCGEPGRPIARPTRSN